MNLIDDEIYNCRVLSFIIGLLEWLKQYAPASVRP
jgi:hypothetical protein